MMLYESPPSRSALPHWGWPGNDLPRGRCGGMVSWEGTPGWGKSQRWGGQEEAWLDQVARGGYVVCVALNLCVCQAWNQGQD